VVRPRVRPAWLTALAVLWLLLPSMAAAQPPGTTDAAVAVARLMGLDRLLLQVSRQSITPLVEQVMAADPQFTEADREQMAQAWAQVIRREVRQGFLHRMAGELQRRFTDRELAELRRFYAGPAGGKLARLQGELWARGRQAGLAEVRAWLDGINAEPAKREAFFQEVNRLLDPELQKKMQPPPADKP